MDLSISIVTWKAKNLLKDCLDSIFNNQWKVSYEVFVVDNNSQDGTIEMIKKEYPSIKLIANKENLGYAKANNQGFKESQGRYFFLLNADTVVPSGTLTKLVKFMDDHALAGALGCKLIHPDGSLQRSVRSFPTILNHLYSCLFLDQLFPKSKTFGQLAMTNWDYNDIKEVDQPAGAALVIRPQALKDAGMFDESFFLLFEDVDLCYRIKKANWKIYFTPEVEIIHHEGATYKKRASWESGWLYTTSRNKYFLKHYGLISVILITIFDLIKITIYLLPIIIIFIILRRFFI